MPSLLGTMVTITTYGSWLRGNARGWVDDGIVYPPDPLLESGDRTRMKYESFRFASKDLRMMGDTIRRALVERLNQQVFAFTIQTWHAHFAVGVSDVPVADVVKCAKDAARWRLRIKQSIWTTGYDKRFCFDEESLIARIRYVERHNEQLGWQSQPWEWLTKR